MPPKAKTSVDRARGRTGKRQKISIEIDRDILDHFVRLGPDWQWRMSEALRRAVEL